MIRTATTDDLDALVGLNPPEQQFHTEAGAAPFAHQLGVDPDVRRRGLGRALLEAVEADAVAWGADRVTIDTWSFNATAQAFFASCGYEVFNVRLRRQLDPESATVASD
jgi:GNAT superfamily N-acetyltransferase